MSLAIVATQKLTCLYTATMLWDMIYNLKNSFNFVVKFSSSEKKNAQENVIEK